MLKLLTLTALLACAPVSPGVIESPVVTVPTPADDEAVQEAAAYAVTTLQNRTHSPRTLKLLEVQKVVANVVRRGMYYFLTLRVATTDCLVGAADMADCGRVTQTHICTPKVLKERPHQLPAVSATKLWVAPVTFCKPAIAK